MVVDELIAQLTEMKKRGEISGITEVGIDSKDNNGVPGMVSIRGSLSVVCVARNEYSKGWGLVKVVSRGGVPVVRLS